MSISLLKDFKGFGKKPKSQKDLLMEEKRKRLPKVPKTVQESIPYVAVYPNGVIEVRPNFYCKSYAFTDMNFSDAMEADQYDMKDQWAKLLNLFTPEMNMQISIFNRCIDEASVYNDILIKPKPDEYNSLREAANTIIKNAMAAGRNNLESEKYITFSFAANSLTEAMSTFSRMDHQIGKAFRDINENVEVTPISTETRLSILYDLYNPYNKISFDRQLKDSTKSDGFKLETLKKIGLTTKDIIGPENIKFKSNYIELGDKFAKVLFVTNLPAELSSDFLSDVANQECSALTSIHFKQIDNRKANFMVKNKMTDINKDMVKQQKNASTSGFSAALISPDLQQAQLDASEFLEAMMSSDQKCFLATIQIILFAESLEELNDCTETLRSVVSRYTCDVKTYKGQQEIAFNSALPFAYNVTCTDRLLQTESASIFIPFSTHDISQKNGIVLGQNLVSHNIIRVNQQMLDNYNGMILGKSGSGKSMQAKWEIIMRILATDDDICIIDPDNEYRHIAALFPDDAEVIDMMPGATKYINPMDLDIDDTDGADPIATKISYMYGFMSMVFGDSYVLSPVQKSILARCVTALYKPYIKHLENKSAIENRRITLDYSAAPTLSDLYDMLFSQNDAESAQMAVALEMYCSGPNGMFSHKTNINPKKRIIIYNIKELGEGLKELGLYTCEQHAWNRIISNSRIGKITDVYTDEFHIIIHVKSAIESMLSMYKRARKFGGAMKGITQNITDIFSSEAATKILANCNFVTIMNQFEYDREQLAGLYNLSDSEKKYITNATAGSGLMKIGKNVYPFENPIPHDSAFYKAMSTKLQEDNTRNNMASKTN